MATEGYVRPDLLVETDWLEAHLDDPNIRIVDCEPFDAYRRAHIENAVGLRVHPYIQDPNYPQVMPAESFTELVENMGIGDNNLIVTYDSGWGLSATRFWWVMNYYGHTNVKVLNGGWGKWFGEGRPAAVGDGIKLPKAKFTVNVNPDIICKLDYGISSVGNPEVVFLDVRSDGEWDGTNTRGNSRAGHIPGAVHLEWLNFLSDGPYQTIRPAHELRAMLEKVGVTPEKQVITY